MTSVGHRVPQAVTSMRAGIARIGEYPLYEPILREPGVVEPEPLIASAVAGVTDGLTGIERLLALGVPALQEAVTDAGLKEEDLGSVPLFLVGGQHAAMAPGTRIATVLGPRLAGRVCRSLLPKVHYIPAGSAGVLMAIKRAIEALRKRQVSQCIVGAVHSWLDHETLVWLDQTRRLKNQENADGFVPGEAAAFLVLELADTAARRKQPAYAECADVVLAEEKHTISVETPCTGEALTTCLRGVLAELGNRKRKADVVLCDLNGESYRSTEWSYAITKSFRNDHAVPPVFHPADCIGDVGAAMGGVLLGLTAVAMKKDFVPWKTAVVWCSSDHGERAACAVMRV
jgi:3-oxoacyl-[acyl-carrier-protein] synthase-1